jgi:Tol biopolymer transport system component
MGEVYKATDTRLGRTVAIKVLPDHVAADAAFKARFEREARALSSLNHPHICTIHDIGSQQGTDFLVMEHLEGETLADRLTKGPLPLAQALSHAIAIADALDKAHRQGIVHRDLKPGNIMLTKTGAKLLDFGLAKSVGPAQSGHVQGDRGFRLQPEVSAAQTIASPLTGTGTILGTFQYMAPEQLEGQEADTRSDIFAFGAVLYEMVTGQRAFTGSSQASLIAAIMGAEPRAVSAIVPVAPRALDHLVARCLAKAPDDRWQTARDVHQELQWVLDQPSADSTTTSVAVSTRTWRTVLPVAAAALVAGAAMTALVLRFGTEASAPLAVTRLQATRTAARWNITPQLPQVAISRDGRTIAFVGGLPNGTSGIFLRPLGAENATLIAGSENSATFGPVFSPDGTWIVFRTLQELLKVPVGGGRPTSLTRFGGGAGTNAQGLSWSADDWIYYTESTGQAASSLFRVRANGGQQERLVTTTGSVMAWPQALGDGRFVLFIDNGRDTTTAGAAIKLVDTQTRKTDVLLDVGGASPAVTASGHLLFVRDGSLFAVPFDQNRLTVSGTPREVLSGIQYEPASGVAQYAVAADGTLVYQSGAAPGTILMWADARGAVRAFPEEKVYYDPRLSPDGRFVAAEVLGDGDDIWVMDLTRGTQTKLSLGVNEDETPAWSPDERWVAWSTNRDAKRVILRKRADGSGQEEVLWSGAEHAHVVAFTPDGQSLLFEKQTVERNTDIWLLPLDGSGKERLVLGTAFNEVGARLSPDGRWLAYLSDETGIPQVYVQPFPMLLDARFLISKSGGAEPVWSRDGRRLFYRSNDVMWSVSIAPGATFKPGIPERVFDGPYQNKAVTHTGYDVGSDGRFLVIGNSSPQAGVLTVILNWTEELKRLVPVK